MGLDVKQAPSQFATRIPLIVNIGKGIPYSIAVTGTLLEGIRSIPDSVYFGIIERGDTSERVVNVMSRDPEEKLRPEDLTVTMNVPGATGDVVEVLQKDKTVELRVRLTSTGVRGVASGVMRIANKEDTGLTVPVKVYIK